MKEKYKILIIVVSGLAAILIVFLIVLPMAHQIKQLSEETYDQRVALEKMYERGKNIKESRENFTKIKEEIEFLDNVYNYRGQELKFITSLEKIASEKNVNQVINIMNEEDKNEKNLEKTGLEVMKVDLTLTGDFMSILSYLDQLQQEDYYFNIDFLSLQNINAKNFVDGDLLESQDRTFVKALDSPEIKARVSGTTYWK